ncbi:lysine N(6)-hydroxylase/L-ornithine N(5)-oxygenase family protein [Streptomyces sp. NPDC127110]|uniref:lysine N(6)-hydroxylase/L-ornithine N(5)-oxygenase family protein n=1 Tax=Streptomyces sp. NPDC127110 TaxID=3345362 RepID=UPI00363396FC
MQDAEQHDLVGIGTGPTNLSLAALAEPVPNLSARFLDAGPEFRWHPGMMVPDAELQVSYLKDLVTTVDPTSRFSFLNYLAENGRLFRSMIANRDRCTRQEFEQYYRWVARQLPSLRWNRPVEEVRLRDDRLEAVSGRHRYSTGSLVLGTGRVPVLPGFAEPFRGAQVLHSADLLHVDPQVRGKDVLVIGGGQSGAEVVHHFLGPDTALPARLTWISSRSGFQPLDDSPFTNEWFAPDYVDHFYRLGADRRQELLRRQRLASDGITESLLEAIYRRLYQLDFLTGGPATVRHRLLTGRRAVGLERDGDRLVAAVHDQDLDRREAHPADVVVFCTGYRSALPACLDPLAGRLLNARGEYEVNRDYSLAWDGPAGVRIHVQNMSETTHGVADPNLSLAAWRSAQILNAVTGRKVYRVDHETSTTDWGGGSPHAVATPAEQPSTPRRS